MQSGALGEQVNPWGVELLETLRTAVQALLIGTVAAVISSMLLLLALLENPFHGGFDGHAPGGHGAHVGDHSGEAQGRRPGHRVLPCGAEESRCRRVRWTG